MQTLTEFGVPTRRGLSLAYRVLVAALIPLPLAAAQQPKGVVSTAPASRPERHTAPGAEDGAGGNAPLSCEWLPFPDAAKFSLRGLHWFNENKPRLWRLPQARLDALPTGVQRGCRAPAGARILMECDTSTLALRVMPVTRANRKGFDVEVNGKLLRSVAAEHAGVESELLLFEKLGREQKEIVIYLPTHQEVVVTAIGTDKAATFKSPEHKYARALPVVFYGSSVCQGSGTMKPAMTYEAILCRALNLDFVNLGFGGAGKAETAVVELVNSVPACCYVFDLGKSYGTQDKTAYKAMLQMVRRSHPDVAIICITPITSAREVKDASYSSRSLHTRKVMEDAARELIAAGDQRLYLVEGPELLGFKDHAGLSRDGVHPSEAGYALIAARLLPTLKKAIGG